MLGSSKALPLTLALATLALATLSIFVGCTSSSTTQARFVNAISDAGPLDIEVDGVKEFTGVSFPAAFASTYTAIPAGNDTINGLPAGGTTVTFTTHDSLNSGSAYTLVGNGLLSGNIAPAVTPFVDNNTAPANGFVNFRIINASYYGPGGGKGAADIYIIPNPNPVLPGSCALAGIDCISNIAYQSASGYVTLPYNSAGSGWQMYVTLAGSPTPYFNVTLGNVGSASEGAICTLLLTDEQNGTEMSFAPLKLNDLNCSNL
jgi:hypothetical protein